MCSLIKRAPCPTPQHRGLEVLGGVPIQNKLKKKNCWPDPDPSPNTTIFVSEKVNETLLPVLGVPLRRHTAPLYTWSKGIKHWRYSSYQPQPTVHPDSDPQRPSDSLMETSSPPAPLLRTHQGARRLPCPLPFMILLRGLNSGHSLLE